MIILSKTNDKTEVRQKQERSKAQKQGAEARKKQDRSKSQK